MQNSGKHPQNRPSPSDVIKVEGEDQATPGPLKRNVPGTLTIPQYRFNKTKQHTHTHRPKFYV